jgi:hypothetical protein
LKQHPNTNLPTASGGVSWTPKAPEQRGFVWQQALLLDVNAPEEKKKEAKEAKQLAMGHCYKCKKAIYEQMVSLDQKRVAHVACHTCVSCKKELIGSAYFEDAGGKSKCEACAGAQKSKSSGGGASNSAAPAKPTQTSLGTCEACGKNIEKKVMSSDGKSWHPECFKCLKCNRLIKNLEPFFPQDNGVTCEDCE